MLVNLNRNDPINYLIKKIRMPGEEDAEQKKKTDAGFLKATAYLVEGFKVCKFFCHILVLLLASKGQMLSGK